MLVFFRRAPLVLITLFFTSGVICGFEFSCKDFWIIIVFFVLFAAILWLYLTKKAPFIQTSFILFSSCLLGFYTTDNFLDFENQLPNGSIELTFQIEKKLRANQYIGAFDDNLLLLELENCDTLLPGNELTVIGEIKEIELPKLPWLFNQKKQMLANGITHQFYVSQIIKTSIQKENSPRLLPQKIQSSLQQKITSGIADSSSAAILSALILGETSLLSKDITSDYSVAGVIHILAVSGMHVALIYQIILFILKLFLRKKRKWLTFFIAITLLWGYGAITGFSASVVRACCMFSFFVLSDCFLLSRNTGNTIAGSTLLILYFQPYLIFNLGFLLSMSAVLGIVVIHPMIMRLCYTENKIGYYLISSTSITLSATLTTLPLTLFIFHSFPTYFVLANLILVPWSTVILYVGIAFLIFSGIPYLGTFITVVLDLTTRSMNGFIHLIHFLPKAQISEINFNQEQLILSYCLILTIALFLFFKWKSAIHFAGLTLLLFVSFSFQIPKQTGHLFTYYQSNILLIGNEKELFLACDNDTIASKYIHKLNVWKCSQNRAQQSVNLVSFPTLFSWNEEGRCVSIATFRSRKKSPILLLNEELKMKKADSALTNEFQHEKILLGKGLSRKKQELLHSYLKESNIPLQNIQSEPFILK